MAFTYAPDDEHHWIDLGSARKRNWHKGIPKSCVIDGVTYEVRVYAGHVWARAVASESETPPVT